ncbi:hypothetical protein BRARA_H01246 [Brassica rapa]|uniref:Uncharacterized protein n=1 Tax=Brassica campestris TaxID=3711 RepID=A0A397YHN5_BRACM|nr:hypothetical protein BRARA_H01246 [Brassica rapa]
MLFRSYSGWTLYLDHSVSSSASLSCLRDISGSEDRRRSKVSWNQNYNIYEEDSVKIVNSLVPKKQNKRENKGRDYEKMTRFLMILLMLHKSVGGNIIDQTFTESTLDYSQGVSATHFQFQDKAAIQEHYVYLHMRTKILNNEFSKIHTL